MAKTRPTLPPPHVMPLSEFAEETRAVIEDLVDRPRPPRQWVKVCYGLAQVQSRAWLEWHWARGIDPEKLRQRLSPGLRALVIERDGLVCGLCAGDVERDDVHIDHIVPVVQGGSDAPTNLQVTHSLCNLRKGGR